MCQWYQQTSNKVIRTARNHPQWRSASEEASGLGEMYWSLQLTRTSSLQRQQLHWPEHIASAVASLVDFVAFFDAIKAAFDFGIVPKTTACRQSRKLYRCPPCFLHWTRRCMSLGTSLAKRTSQRKHFAKSIYFNWIIDWDYWFFVRKKRHNKLFLFCCWNKHRT